jgi:acetyl esterase/lipase
MRSLVGLCLLLVLSSGCGRQDVGDVEAELGEQFRYGDGRKHFGVISRPAGNTRLPVVVLIHGGFWRDGFGLDLMSPLGTDLVDRGYAVWNLEYRGVGDAGGGFPETLDDVSVGIEYLSQLEDRYQLDLDRVAFVGHSAGGHLALWAGGAGLEIEPSIVVGQAAVVDLYAAAAANLGAGAAQAFVGGEPEEWPDRYAKAQPKLSDRVVLVHGDRDDVVPVDQSAAFVDEVEVVVIPDEGHFAAIDPASASWAAVIAALEPL